MHCPMRPASRITLKFLRAGRHSEAAVREAELTVGSFETDQRDPALDPHEGGPLLLQLLLLRVVLTFTLEIVVERDARAGPWESTVCLRKNRASRELADSLRADPE